MEENGKLLAFPLSWVKVHGKSKYRHLFIDFFKIVRFSKRSHTSGMNVGPVDDVSRNYSDFLHSFFEKGEVFGGKSSFKKCFNLYFV